MDRRRFVRTGALGVIGSVADARPELVGTWRVLNYEDRPHGGKPLYPYGEHPIGLLVYDASGHMSVQITKGVDREALARIRPAKPGTERPEPAYTAYFGTYTVDWERKVITHLVEGNLFPAFVGTKHERPFELDGDRLVLRPRWDQDGRAFEGVRLFERLR